MKNARFSKRKGSDKSDSKRGSGSSANGSSNNSRTSGSMQTSDDGRVIGQFGSLSSPTNYNEDRISSKRESTSKGNRNGPERTSQGFQAGISGYRNSTQRNSMGRESSTDFSFSHNGSRGGSIPDYSAPKFQGRSSQADGRDSSGNAKKYSGDKSRQEACAPNYRYNIDTDEFVLSRKEFVDLVGPAKTCNIGQLLCSRSCSLSQVNGNTACTGSKCMITSPCNPCQPTCFVPQKVCCDPADPCCQPRDCCNRCRRQVCCCPKRVCCAPDPCECRKCFTRCRVPECCEPDPCRVRDCCERCRRKVCCCRKRECCPPDCRYKCCPKPTCRPEPCECREPCTERQDRCGTPIVLPIIIPAPQPCPLPGPPPRPAQEPAYRIVESPCQQDPQYQDMNYSGQQGQQGQQTPQYYYSSGAPDCPFVPAYAVSPNQGQTYDPNCCVPASNVIPASPAYNVSWGQQPASVSSDSALSEDSSNPSSGSSGRSDHRRSSGWPGPAFLMIASTTTSAPANQPFVFSPGPFQSFQPCGGYTPPIPPQTCPVQNRPRSC